HVVVAGWNASRHAFTDPAQWSPASLSHTSPFNDPVQLVVDDANASAGQAPDDPVQDSATSHWPAAGRHVVVAGWNASMHAFPDPEQWSPASLSHASPFDDPVQLVVADANASAGQAPDDPVHDSATSHWPAAPRHVVVAGWNVSTQAFPDPEQWSAASLSHAPPFDDPVQLVVAGANASAGQAPDDPVQDSATSHWPAALRHVVVAGRNAAMHGFPDPEQWSAASLSHAPPVDDPVQLVVDDANASAGQAPDDP